MSPFFYGLKTSVVEDLFAHREHDSNEFAI